jgi:undecaprenyl-diphosphatase
MSLERVIEETKDFFLPYGPLGLFALAFIESSFFIVPPDVLLIPLCLVNPELAFFYASVCTIGSVSGAIFGYYIGKKGGRPVLLKYASEDKIKKVEELFRKHGTLAVGLAGFTPIPYKVFTISSGVFNHKIHPFIIVSLIGRGLRFFSLAAIIKLYGDKIMGIISSYFEAFSLALGLAVLLIYIAYRKMSSPKRL